MITTGLTGISVRSITNIITVIMIIDHLSIIITAIIMCTFTRSMTHFINGMPVIVFIVLIMFVITTFVL